MSDGHEAYEYRPLRPWTNALAVVTAMTLALAAAAAIPWLAEVVPTGPALQISQKVLAFANLGIGVAWLYRASLNAHAFWPDMKYSPRAAVVWFFVPALNFLFTMAVMYEIWARSGGPRRSSLLILWWAVTVPSINVLYPMWLLSDAPATGAYVLLAAAPICFLALAWRIDRLQAGAAIAAEFGEDPEPEPPAPEPDEFWRPGTFTRESTDDTRPDGAIDPAVGTAPARLAPSPTGRPGIVVVKRPPTGPAPSST